MRSLACGSRQSVDGVLIACILFVCVEFLRGHHEAAISHARHGVYVLNSTGKTLQITAEFFHLSIFPLFFGGNIQNFPLLAHRDDSTRGFGSFVQAQHTLDVILVRAVRLVRAADKYRLGLNGEDEPPVEMLLEQSQVDDDLESWNKAFDEFRGSSPADTASTALRMRYLVSKIWASHCLMHGEMHYDDSKADFEHIIDMARTVDSVQQKFMFGMGFTPLLHFVALKCRYLQLRLEALELLNKLSCTHEGLWDARIMHDVAKRIVEVEHGSMGTLPPDNQRVRDYFLQQGQGSSRIVCMVVSNPNGGVEIKKEWIIIR